MVAASYLAYIISMTEHNTGSQLISKYQYTPFQMADIQTKVDAARLLVQRAAQAKQNGEPYTAVCRDGQIVRF